MPSAQVQVPSRRAPATTFEELLVWQRAKELSLRVYRVTAKGPLARDLGLRSQIQRAAVSVMSNIAEGFERNSRAEFARFLAIARGSAGEVRSQVYLAEELGYVDAENARIPAVVVQRDHEDDHRPAEVAGRVTQSVTGALEPGHLNPWL